MGKLPAAQAALEVLGQNGATPLHVAAANGHSEALELLMEALPFWGLRISGEFPEMF